jgi:hypothetical protein
MLLEAGRALDAREQFAIIVTERPAFMDAAVMLGLASYLAGDGLGARAIWDDCRERRPEDPRVEAYLAMLERSDTSGAELVSTAPLPAIGRPAKGARKKKK